MFFPMAMHDINISQYTMINAQSKKDHGIDEGEKYDEEDGDVE